MIPPEQAALADAIMKENEANFEQAVEIAAYMIKHLRKAGYAIRKEPQP